MSLAPKPERSPRVLVIRRENIGDLVCTTPLIRALRAQLPDAHIAALASDYSAAVLAGNPDVDKVHVYTKGKHRAPGVGPIGIYARRLALILKLHRERFDWILLPGGPHASALRFARWIGGRHVLVRGPQDAAGGPHEVEQCCHLLVRMGLLYDAPPTRLSADPAAAQEIEARVAAHWAVRPRRLIGMHISARKPSQRWPVASFAKLAQALHGEGDVGLMLLWAPGGGEDRLHPGDDDKAGDLMAEVPDVPVLPVATHRLDELVAAISLCDELICSDGGAMHLAAALEKPVVCLFGQSDAAHWRPWGVPFELLQKASRDVASIEVPEVVGAWRRLRAPERPRAAPQAS